MANGQYIKVYHVVKDEYPQVWASDAQLATFIRLLMIADKWWPQWAPKPFGRPTYAYRSLVEAGLVVVSPDGNGFSVRGLNKERQGRSEHGKRAAGIRWSNAASNAQPMPSKAEQSKAEQRDEQSPPQTFMGWKPKPTYERAPGEAENPRHNGSHPVTCLVCHPLPRSGVDA